MRKAFLLCSAIIFSLSLFAQQKKVEDVIKFRELTYDFGKIKQNNVGLNIDRSKTSVNINERMDTVIPASKIANQNAGEVVAIVSRDNNNDLKEYQTNTFKCKIKLDLSAIDEEKKHYLELPKYYDFGGEESKRIFLSKNLEKIYKEIDNL